MIEHPFPPGTNCLHICPDAVKKENSITGTSVIVDAFESTDSNYLSSCGRPIMIRGAHYVVSLTEGRGTLICKPKCLIPLDPGKDEFYEEDYEEDEDPLDKIRPKETVER